MCIRDRLYADSGREKLCTRHSIRLDQLIELVSERIRHYVQSCYRLKELELPPPPDTRRDALEQEQKSLTTQLERRSQALKNLYLDRVSGILSEGQFVELNQDFLAEKSRLERRLVQIDIELGERAEPVEQAALDVYKRQMLTQSRKLPPIQTRIQKTLAMVGLPDVGARYPVALSYGECRRVELARAIINSPSILVLDELTANLDEDTIWDILHLLCEINRHGTTTVSYTHLDVYKRQGVRRAV